MIVKVKSKIGIAVGLISAFLLVGCSESEELNISANDLQGAYTIDYEDSASFELALNSGEDVTGKVVRFDVLEYHPDSKVGINCYSGEHLNFISDEDVNAKNGDEIIAFVKETPKSVFDSWIIKYEVLEHISPEVSDNYEESVEVDETEPEVEEDIFIIEEEAVFDFGSIPEYSNKPYYEMNENTPYFLDEQMCNQNYMKYSDLGVLDRASFAVACIDKEVIPMDDTEVPDDIIPTGWMQKSYSEDAISGELYKKIGLIGFGLGGAVDERSNIVTSTKYMYEDGIQPFEEQIADYVKTTENHVLYRVTPVFEEDYLIASGVLLEAKSVEDLGEGLEFCVYCYNVQPGIEINYEDGTSISIEEQKKFEEQKKLEEKKKAEEQKKLEEKKKAEEQKKLEEQRKAEEAAKAAKAAEAAAASTAVAATATQTQSSAPASGGMCWLSATGSKYHSIDHCGKMNQSKARQVSIAEAEASGMTRCSKCW